MSKKLLELSDTEYNHKSMIVTSFYGGKKKGKCLQFSLVPGYMSLDKIGVEALRNCLNDWLDSFKEVT